MIRSLMVITSVATLGLAGGSALAGERGAAAGPAETGAAARPVYVCASDMQTRREFARQHGEARFMNAEQIAAAASAGERWATPRCVREDQLIRYQAMVRDRERVQVAAR